MQTLSEITSAVTLPPSFFPSSESALSRAIVHDGQDPSKFAKVNSAGLRRPCRRYGAENFVGTEPRAGRGDSGLTGKTKPGAR
ncbi:hypothetical protein MPL3356_490030 [Mesorhizobium plurifarium]|uniref:Uncharacterized protein n=1 Tax=Mesorhizobium plurifarium TaxID=69974 RepID=A0A090EBJ1_MESPL|nr:hypothetical protein MPL3356_490030 [Mesorhizobium plurifarium]